MIDQNCESIEFIALATGDRSILVHGLPSEQPLRDYTHGRIDFGGLFDHYNSDVARTFLIGKENDKHKAVFENMVKIYVSAIESCRVGVPASTPFFVAKKVSEGLDMPFNRVHEGHGLGLAIHEKPILSPNNRELFQENMVICVEHGMHVDGYRYHIEDLIHITKEGPVVLSQPQGLNPTLYHIKK